MSSLNIAATALNADLAALQVIGHNIANVNTDGYSRQTIQLASAGGQQTGAGFFGQGVVVANVARAYDTNLQRTALQTASVSASDDIRYQQLQSLENLFPLGSAGLGNALNTALNSWVDVASSPTDLTARTVAISSAQDFTTQLNSTAANLDQLRLSANSQIGGMVGTINTLAAQIADVNQRIVAAQGGSGQPNDLMDQRDQLIKQLNQYVQTTSVTATDGSVNLFVAGSQPLVMGAVPSKLTAVQDATDPSHTSISIQQSSGTFPVNQSFLGGGQLNGLLTFVNKDISQAFNYLGRLGLSLGTQVNTQSHLGLDLNGNAGIDFYSIPALPAGIPATGNGGTAGATIQVANPTQLQASDYQIQFSGPNAGSIVRTSDGATVAQFNSTASPITVDGLSFNITGSAAAGDIVTLKPYEAVARNLGVAVSSPQNVAASSPLLVTPTLQPTSGLTVSAAYLTSGSLPTSPATLPTVTLTYSSGSGSFTVTDSGGNNLGTIAYVPGQPLTFQENLSGGNVVSYSVKLAGAPANGDVVTLTQGTGTQMNQNSGNAQAMLALRDVPSFNGVGLADGYTTVFSAVASNVQGGKSAAQFSDTAATSAQSALSNVTGVNLDEEASRLMQFQQAYQAAAKFMQTANSTFSTLIQAFS